ncbi:MAG: hypothetical protein KGR98_03250 [Verrucomicrobia bacterium]|nr:hypothetical protein [Verrucomicrobiota bacterium]MDE3098627.1 hypothetical protein [Verrucomicrobiota bacterium]
MGSSSKSATPSNTYDYYGSIACGLCVGPVADLIGIVLDGQAVWPQGNVWIAAGGFNVNNGDLYVYDAQTWVAQQSFAVPANPSSSDPTVPGNDAAYWVEYTFAPGAEAYDDFTITTPSNSQYEGTTYGNLRIYWGAAAQAADAFLNSISGGETHPGYIGVCYCIAGPDSAGFLLGQQVQSAPNLEIIVRRQPQQTVVIGAAAGITDGQCNLAAFIAEILTSENAIGLPAAMLDAMSFNAVATYLQNNESLYGASPLIDTADTLRSVLDQFTQMIDGFIRFNPATGLIELGVYEHGVTPANYTKLTEDSLTERPQLKSTSWQQTYSRATVRFNDRTLNFQQTSLHADDPRAWAVLKSVREISLDRPWITRSEQALLHGRETLRVVGHSQLTGTLSVRREIGRGIRAGDYVLLDVDIEPNVQTIFQFCRVTKRTIPMTGPIKLEVLADNTLAPIPFNGPSGASIPSTGTVPAVTTFRLAEIPTVLSGQRGAVAAFVQRPTNLVVGCQLWFDTNPTGTFQQLGVLTGFAAKATLRSNVAAADSVIHANVDTTQPDATFFTEQFTANQAADDTMLAVLVSVVSDPGQPDDKQIAETAGGYAELEICSVSTQTLVQAGQYDLTVLRGRQNTTAQAFAAASSELWLIPRANMRGFASALFATLRANRVAGLAPSYGQFRFLPYTYSAQYQLSAAADEPFHFPLASSSSPSLALTAPAAFSLSEAPAGFPFRLQVAGKWTDPDASLVEIKILLRGPNDTADRTVVDRTFAPTGEAAFNTWVQLDATGNWTIKLIARDATNLQTEQDIAVDVTSAPAQTCAMADVFDSAGNQVTGNLAVINGQNQITATDYVAFGPLALKCSTPGATIYFTSAGPFSDNGTLTSSPNVQAYVAGDLEPMNINFYTAQQVYTGGHNPYTTVYSPATQTVVTVWASAPGYGNSPQLTYIIPLTFGAQPSG